MSQEGGERILRILTVNLIKHHWCPSYYTVGWGGCVKDEQETNKAKYF